MSPVPLSPAPLSIAGSPGLGIVIFLAIVVGAPIALGVMASLLTLPGLLTTGYGIVPPRYAPALGATTVRKAAFVHVMLGTLLVCGFVFIVRPFVYIVALLTGYDFLQPAFLPSEPLDIALSLVVLTLVWTAFGYGFPSRETQTERRSIRFRSGLSFLLFLLGTVTAFFLLAGVAALYAVDPAVWPLSASAGGAVVLIGIQASFHDSLHE